MKTDAEIVQDVMQGHREAYAQLVERYEQPLFGYIVKIVRNTHWAEEIAQETFVRAYEKLNTLRNPSGFGAWLFKTARREAWRSLRTRQRCESIEPAHRQNLSENPVMILAERETLLDAVAALSEKEQKILFLKHFGGYTAQEIGHMNGSPAGAITKLLSRAYARLRNRLQERES